MLFVDLFKQIGDPNLFRSPAKVERNLDGRTDVIGVDVAVPDAVTAHHDDRIAQLSPSSLEVLDPRINKVEEIHHLVALIGYIDFVGTAHLPSMTATKWMCIECRCGCSTPFLRPPPP